MFKKYYQFIAWGLLLVFNIITILFIGYLHYYKNDSAVPVVENEIISEQNLSSQKEVDDTPINVEIKGAVNKPGVYQMKKESIINDVVQLAQGLKRMLILRILI